MIKKIRIGRWRITFTLAPVTDVIGVNSTLADGNHILMWDFDDTDFDTVLKTLHKVRRVYELPPIYILETKRNENYIAYCLARLPLRKAVEVIAFTPGVDWNYFKYGVYREHFTLRVTPKCGRMPLCIWKISSDKKEEVGVDELLSWTKYETLADDARV